METNLRYLKCAWSNLRTTGV